MALIQTKTMTREDPDVEWQDLDLVPPRYYDPYDPVIEIGLELSLDGLIMTETTEWPSLEHWNEAWTHEEEWQATYDYWTENNITVTWRLVDDSTDTELGFVARGYTPT